MITFLKVVADGCVGRLEGIITTYNIINIKSMYLVIKKKKKNELPSTVAINLKLRNLCVGGYLSIFVGRVKRLQSHVVLIVLYDRN